MRKFAQNAPNGKLTNLTADQWALVRTKRFKEKLGDWERATQVSKLLKSESVVATGEEWKGKYELRSGSATDYILNFLRFDKDGERIEYTNTDTGSVIIVSGSASEVTSHGSNTHLKTVALIPQIIRESVFLGEEANKKNKRGFTSFRYYATGLKLGDVDYTVRLTTCAGDDEIYYDHSLTEIKKRAAAPDQRDLLDTQVYGREATPSGTKDERLISFLQGDFSKFSNIVDENGEPRSVEVDAFESEHASVQLQQLSWIKQDGEVRGWFNPDTNTIVLCEGHNNATALEAFWHATFHLAKTNTPVLYNKMLAYAQSVRKSKTHIVKNLYPELKAKSEAWFDKIGAMLFVMEHADKIEKSLNPNVFIKMWRALGNDKVNIDKIAKLQSKRAIRALAKAFASGKHLA